MRLLVPDALGLLVGSAVTLPVEWVTYLAPEGWVAYGPILRTLRAACVGRAN
jgi:hypothetical protein